MLFDTVFVPFEVAVWTPCSVSNFVCLDPLFYPFGQIVTGCAYALTDGTPLSNVVAFSAVVLYVLQQYFFYLYDFDECSCQILKLLPGEDAFSENEVFV